MVLLALGFNYQKAPLSLREKLVFPDEQAKRLLTLFLKERKIVEAVLISTCNRTEFYWVPGTIDSRNDSHDQRESHESRGSRDSNDSNDLNDSTKDNEIIHTLRWLAEKCGLNFEELLQNAYWYHDIESVKHLLRVASGMNSMVIGEVEILGQIKSAYSLALRAGTLGKKLDQLFQFAFSIAKRVRSQTDIGTNPVSVASLAVRLSHRLAKRIFTNIKEITVLLIGAGNLNKKTAVHLKTLGVRKILVTNRTLEASMSLASLMNANANSDTNVDVEVFSFDALPNRLSQADIVISGTASDLPIIGKGMVERALKVRKHRPMVMIDLAMPRDIEPEIHDLEDIYLYCLDDLQVELQQNLASRRDAALQAEEIIAEFAAQFFQKLYSKISFDAVKALRKQMHDLKDQTLKAAQKQLRLGKSPELVLEQALHGLTNRLLHGPTTKLREMTQIFGRSSEDILNQVMQLFDLKMDFEDFEDMEVFDVDSISQAASQVDSHPVSQVDSPIDSKVNSKQDLKNYEVLHTK